MGINLIDIKYKVSTETALNPRVPNKAMENAFQEERNLAGAMKPNIAMQTVKVYTIDMAVLMATIIPNLVKNWMVVKHRGTAARMVVRAELRMDDPM